MRSKSKFLEEFANQFLERTAENITLIIEEEIPEEKIDDTEKEEVKE